MVKRYRNVSLPEELLNHIEAVIRSNKFGYTSKGEFVKEAVRVSLKELGILNINYVSK